jgi:DNA-binding transcriptional regulator LsrR (DeoR family)
MQVFASPLALGEVLALALKGANMRNEEDHVLPSNVPKISTPSDEPKRPTDVAKLIDVARSFYIEDEDKGKIAKRLRVAPRKITPWLKEAKRTGLVRIDIHEPPSMQTRQFESELLDRFRHLQMVKVVPCRKIATTADYLGVTRRLASEAAGFFDDVVDGGKELHVGMSGGETWLEFVNAVPDRPRPRVFVYATTLIGRGHLTLSASHVDALVNSSVLWAKCGREPGHNRYATVPPYDSVGTRLGLARELQLMADREPIRSVIREMDKISLAFVGIGVVNPPKATQRHNARLTMLSLLQPYGPSPETLVEEGAIGEMAGSLFNENGVIRKGWQFFLSAGHYHAKGGGIEFYKRMVEHEKKAVVIGGFQKEVAILAALKAKAFNYWFTDEIAARTILKMK